MMLPNSAKVRIDGKECRMYDLYNELMEGADTPLKRKGQRSRYSYARKILKENGDYQVRKVNGELLFVTTFIGTDTEYKIHKLLYLMDDIELGSDLYELYDSQVNKLLTYI